MTPRERAENYARVFPHHPPLSFTDRWLTGFWALGQNYRGSGFHGAYPPGYLDRIQAIFPNEFRGKVLHLFSGSLDASVGGVRVEMNLGRDPPPDVFGDAHDLPFSDQTFDLIVADGPYTPADAKKYGTPMINRAAVFRECSRILKTGGHLIWLDARAPMFRKTAWLQWGGIGIQRSTNHIYRAVTFYQRRENVMAKLRARIQAASEALAPALAAALAILTGEDDTSVSEAMASQKSNTKTREGRSDDEEKRGPGRPRKAGPKPPAADDDDDEDEKTTKKKASTDDDEDDDDEDDDEDEGAAIPKDSALAELDRAALKKLAVSHDIDPVGKNREDLTKLLQEKRDGKKASSKPKAKPAADDDDDDDEDEKPKASKKKAAADDEDDEDEKPAKKKKAAKDDEDEKPEEDDYPKVKVMKADLETFFKVNKQMLKDSGFFGGKPKKGVDKSPNTYDEVMGDVDLIKEAWADNVWPIIQSGNWKKTKAEAAEIEDDDDDDDE